ncbi:MAG: hypothetical protein IKO40_05050 [Kiritimatiellae bacterium]|nr:hypothetical protein [Kiritimatiellia bacterium]
MDETITNLYSQLFETSNLEGGEEADCGEGILPPDDAAPQSGDNMFENPDESPEETDLAIQFSDEMPSISLEDGGVEGQLPENITDSSEEDGSVLEAVGSNTETSIFNDVFDIVKDAWDRFFQPFFDPDDIVRPSHFSQDGAYDTKNNVVVVGDVASDIGFIGEQTHGSCSLMAQEQFVHRYIGKPIPEEYLEWQAEKWGVYSPDIGTVAEGQEMILEHFGIPHERVYNPDLDDIVSSMSKGNDVLIGVDARDFYQDASIPPGSGHAVALVGRGLDPATGELVGFYVTDSNYPGAAHYLSIDKLAGCWNGADMISVPEIAA